MQTKIDAVVTTLKAMSYGDPDEIVLLEIKIDDEDEGYMPIDRFLVRRKYIKAIAEKAEYIYRNYQGYDTDSELHTIYSSLDEAIVTLITESNDFEIITIQSESVIIG